MSNKVIIGYSGHSYVVLDAAKKAGFTTIAYTEKEESTYNPFNLEYYGFEGSKEFKAWDKEVEFILGIGNNEIRKRASELVQENRKKLCSVIHPTSCIGSSVTIGEGSFIAAGALINPMVNIGQSAIINTGCIIEHECKIGNNAHVGPGATLAGNVIVGNMSFIGANAVIKEGVSIGNRVIIGAGSTVLNDIDDNCTFVGNPARRIN